MRRFFVLSSRLSFHLSSLYPQLGIDKNIFCDNGVVHVRSYFNGVDCGT